MLLLRARERERVKSRARKNDARFRFSERVSAINPNAFHTTKCPGDCVNPQSFACRHNLLAPLIIYRRPRSASVNCIAFGIPYNELCPCTLPLVMYKASFAHLLNRSHFLIGPRSDSTGNITPTGLKGFISRFLMMRFSNIRRLS